MAESARLSWVFAVFFLLHNLPCAASSDTPFLDQGFFFDYTPPNTPVPIPTTAQCDTIHVEWNRGAATGPNPTAPYYLQIYTSTFIVPFVIPAGDGLSFDWPVPFVPGTQYQICMFDSNGVSGGCQATYTVYPQPNVTVGQPPTCQNVTFPAKAMEVDGVVHNGPISQYGWVDQCTDLSITPKEGVPPYILTVAPALHPPYNITSPDMSPINWTVSLTWGSPFFVSVVDSQGLSWASGPMHSGGLGPTDCLALNSTSKIKEVTESIAIGSGIGGLVLGGLLGILGAWIVGRKRRKLQEVYSMDKVDRIYADNSLTPLNRNNSQNDHDESSHYTAIPPAPLSLQQSAVAHGSHTHVPSSHAVRVDHRSMGVDSMYEIEPFRMPSDVSDVSQLGGDHELLVSHPPGGSTPGTPQTGSHSSREPSASQQEQVSQVYVVHHDAGRAPVSVYTAAGTEVVELPPRYADSPDGPRLQRLRRPAVAPRKQQHSSS